MDDFADDISDILNKDQTDQNIYRIYKGKNSLVALSSPDPVAGREVWNRCRWGDNGEKTNSATLANQISQYSINLTVWQFSILNLRDPARKAFVTGLSWETTSIFTSSFLGSFYCISSRSLICIFSIITYRCGG